MFDFFFMLNEPRYSAGCVLETTVFKNPDPASVISTVVPPSETFAVPTVNVVLVGTVNT